MSGVAMQRSNSIVPPWICLHQVLGADDVGPGRVCLVGLCAAGEHRDAHRLAGAVGQGDNAAHHLVRMTRIDAEVHRDLDGLVELRLGIALDEGNRLLDAEILLTGEGLARSAGIVFRLSHDLPLHLDAHRSGGA